MALTARTEIDDPTCLLVLWVDESKADGAIGQIDATNRRDVSITVWGDYNRKRVEQVLTPGQTLTVTFRGASARAGDVSSVGYY